MVESLLTEALREAVEEAVKDFILPVKTGTPRAPRVINGYLPPKRSGWEDDYPFVIVRAEGGSSEREDTETTVALIIGCYTEEFDGHEQCINVMQRIKDHLLKMPNNILASKYVLQFPITWATVPDQPYPQWRVDMVTKWKYNTPTCEF